MHGCVEFLALKQEAATPMVFWNAMPRRPGVERPDVRTAEILRRLVSRQIATAPELERRMIQVARLTFRLRRARAALEDALAAVRARNG